MLGTRPYGPQASYQYPIQRAIPLDGLAIFRKSYCSLVILSSLIQVTLFHGPDNRFCVAIAAASSLAGLIYSLNTQRFQSAPISCLMLMFYATTSTSGALLVKTLEGDALVERLQVPTTTFPVLFATQLILIATHAFYMQFQQLQALRNFISKRLYAPVGLFAWPTDIQLWLLGALGFLAIAASGGDFESAASFGMGGVGEKILRAFTFLKFTPFLIPFRHALSGTPSPPIRSYVPLMGYFAMLVVLSFATNSRSTFADAVPIVGICVLMAASYNEFSLRNVPSWKIVLAVVSALAISALLSRVALAMVVVRDYRQNLDFLGLVTTTIEALGNSEWLASAKAKMDSTVNLGNYSEEYVNSGFLARFLLTKYHDNILYYFSFFGPDHISSYMDFIEERVWATLPDPILRKLGVNINKEDLIISNGDYIIYMIDGWGLGGFKTGSLVAEVYSVFGVLFPLVLFLCGLLLFVFYDALVTNSVYDRKVVSPLIILLIWNLCGTTASLGFGADSVTSVPMGIVRNLPQVVMFYWLATVMVRFVSRIF